MLSGVMDHDPIAGNRALWDELTPIHAGSAFYDLEGFRAGRSSLYRIEREELGEEVAGKRLLHLQCHFGLDTLSWARMGAEVTGVDLSPRSIELARALADELTINAHFVCASLYELPSVLEASFDIVYTSWGVLAWLPSLTRWADLIAHYLEPDGVFYMAEFHPVVNGFGDDDRPGLVDPYFHTGEVREWKTDGTYADPEARVANRSYQWVHPLGDVITSLIDAGLDIECVREHPRAPERIRPWLSQDEDGWWFYPGDPIPLSFSVRARHR